MRVIISINTDNGVLALLYWASRIFLVLLLPLATPPVSSASLLLILHPGFPFLQDSGSGSSLISLPTHPRLKLLSALCIFCLALLAPAQGWMECIRLLSLGLHWGFAEESYKQGTRWGKSPGYLFLRGH